ncbi:hypothetical protein QT971_27430 [Microcoleus sp. herbarium19]|uniref:hypothetical protein n=1 Tax=Microcoleus sp. herbarium7 TaxID=3055435 RepID=UPI002FD02916
MSRVRSTAIVSAVQFLWNCREAALHIISPLAIDRQLNFLRFRSLCAVGNNCCLWSVDCWRLTVVSLP